MSWFCSLPGHEYFCEVKEDFIEDDFNLTGLNSVVPFWKEAMEMVLDVEPGALCRPPAKEVISDRYLQTRIPPRYRMSPSWKALLRCCTGCVTSATY